MAYTTINNSSLHQTTILYTDSGAVRTLTGVGFQPDFTWIKTRNHTNRHNSFDSVRGATKGLTSDRGDAEYTQADTLTAFTSDGFSLGADASGYGVNYDNKNEVAWNWKAGGAGSSNTDGTINTTATSVNTTAGFSISTYTGTGANATVGHGLGVAPKMIIIKGISNAHWWFVYHAGIPTPTTAKLNLNTDGYNNDPQASYWNSTAPTSSVFSIGTEGSVNTSSATYVAYCFADVTGYSKMGSYVGNGNVNGTFSYTGFKPTWIMTKRATGSAAPWCVFDSKRDGYNNGNKLLIANTTAVESSPSFDIFSNGFKTRTTDGEWNGNGDTYVYMAFGQSIVGTNNIPTTAR